jgi:SAM-dependent methyltransferase
MGMGSNAAGGLDALAQPNNDARSNDQGQGPREVAAHACRPGAAQRRSSHVKDRCRVGGRKKSVVDTEQHVDSNDADDGYSSVSSGDGEGNLIRCNGHTYHGSGDIFVPNDESERARLEIQHGLFGLCLDGKLTFTTLPDPDTLDHPLSILDIGAGTGIWATEMGERYPTARIRGIDVSSTLLPTVVPPNVVFEIADANEPWGAIDGGGDESILNLDFVHVRNIVGGGVRDLKRLFHQAFEHLRPGGQIEVSEVRNRWFLFEDSELDGHDKEEADSLEACQELVANFAWMAEKVGVDFDPITSVRALLEEVGFERAVEMSDLVPFAPAGVDERMRHKGAQLALLIEYGTCRGLSRMPCCS